MADFKLAVIDEAECIGCTKCIQICPFDAIVGAHKQLHGVLQTECTGCGLCIAPCPVDCIQMISIETPLFDWSRARLRRRQRRQRLDTHGVNDQKMELSKEAFAKLPETSEAAKEALLAVIARTRKKTAL